MSIDGELRIGGIGACALAERYGTPLYIYEAETIRSAFRSIDAAVPYTPRRIHYACVANGNIALMQLLHALGAGVHANTWGDAVMALQAGFRPDEIMYTGSNIVDEDLVNLLQTGVAVNLNSLSQLRSYANHLRQIHPAGTSEHARLKNVGLRIHLESAMPYSRMGVKVGEIDDAKAIAAAEGLQVCGVHYYRGTGTNNTEHFLKPFPQVLDIARRFSDTLAYVDFGGGFGFQYLPDAPRQFEWEAFGQEISRMLYQLSADSGRPITLILEPGRSVVAAGGFLLTRVVGVDDRAAGGQVVGVDTTTSHISSETYRVYGGYRRITLANRTDGESVPTDVVGCTTFSDDYIGRASRDGNHANGLCMPSLRKDDLLAVLDAGAYGFAFSSNFLNKPRPAEVIVDAGEARLIRRRETYADLLRLQVY